MVVEVARQVDDEARLFASLDDDVQGLDTQTLSLERSVCGEAGHRAELHVFVQPSADSFGVLRDGWRVGVGIGSGDCKEGERHTSGDVRLDFCKLSQIRAWLCTHARDGGEPVPLLRCTLDEGHERGLGRERGRARRREGDGWQHVLMHVAQ